MYTEQVYGRLPAAQNHGPVGRVGVNGAMGQGQVQQPVQQVQAMQQNAQQSISQPMSSQHSGMPQSVQSASVGDGLQTSMSMPQLSGVQSGLTQQPQQHQQQLQQQQFQQQYLQQQQSLQRESQQSVQQPMQQQQLQQPMQSVQTMPAMQAPIDQSYLSMDYSSDPYGGLAPIYSDGGSVATSILPAGQRDPVKMEFGKSMKAVAAYAPTYTYDEYGYAVPTYNAYAQSGATAVQASLYEPAPLLPASAGVAATPANGRVPLVSVEALPLSAGDESNKASASSGHHSDNSMSGTAAATRPIKLRAAVLQAFPLCKPVAKRRSRIGKGHMRRKQSTQKRVQAGTKLAKDSGEGKGADTSSGTKSDESEAGRTSVFYGRPVLLQRFRPIPMPSYDPLPPERELIASLPEPEDPKRVLSVAELYGLIARIEPEQDALRQQAIKQYKLECEQLLREGRPIPHQPLSERIRDLAVRLRTNLLYRSGLAPRTRFRGQKPVLDSKYMRDLRCSFRLFLFQTGFSINSQESCFTPYGKEHHDFFRALDEGRIPPALSSGLLPTANLPPGGQGCYLVEICDYRHVTSKDRVPLLRRVLLHPTTESIQTEARHIRAKRLQNFSVLAMQDGSVEDLELHLEQQILHATERARHVCLDPSIKVLQLSSLTSYNRNQHPTHETEELESAIPNFQHALSKRRAALRRLSALRRARRRSGFADGRGAKQSAAKRRCKSERGKEPCGMGYKPADDEEEWDGVRGGWSSLSEHDSDYEDETRSTSQRKRAIELLDAAYALPRIVKGGKAMPPPSPPSLESVHEREASEAKRDTGLLPSTARNPKPQPKQMPMFCLAQVNARLTNWRPGQPHPEWDDGDAKDDDLLGSGTRPETGTVPPAASSAVKMEVSGVEAVPTGLANCSDGPPTKKLKIEQDYRPYRSCHQPIDAYPPERSYQPPSKPDDSSDPRDRAKRHAAAVRAVTCPGWDDENVARGLAGSTPRTQHTSALLRWSEFVHHTADAARCEAHNRVLLDPLFSQTMFRKKTLPGGGEDPSVVTTEDMFPSTGAESIVPPHARANKPPQVQAGDMEVHRFQGRSADMSQLHELFAVARSGHGSKSRDPEHTGTFDGVIRVLYTSNTAALAMSDPSIKTPQERAASGGPPPQPPRFFVQYHFPLGGLESKDRFVKQYKLSAHREARRLVESTTRPRSKRAEPKTGSSSSSNNNNNNNSTGNSSGSPNGSGSASSSQTKAEEVTRPYVGSSMPRISTHHSTRNSAAGSGVDTIRTPAGAARTYASAGGASFSGTSSTSQQPSEPAQLKQQQAPYANYGSTDGAQQYPSAYSGDGTASAAPPSYSQYSTGTANSGSLPQQSQQYKNTYNAQAGARAVPQSSSMPNMYSAVPAGGSNSSAVPYQSYAGAGKIGSTHSYSSASNGSTTAGVDNFTGQYASGDTGAAVSYAQPTVNQPMPTQYGAR